jgi:hypothetical protein
VSTTTAHEHIDTESRKHMSSAHVVGLPKVTSTSTVPLRPERGILTLETVRQARFHLSSGCDVELVLYGLSNFGGGVAEYLARVFMDAGVATVAIKASARSVVVDELRDAISAAMADYVQAVTR